MSLLYACFGVKERVICYVFFVIKTSIYISLCVTLCFKTLTFDLHKENCMYSAPTNYIFDLSALYCLKTVLSWAAIRHPYLTLMQTPTTKSIMQLIDI